MPPTMGYHWRTAGAWSDERLEAAWNDLCAGRAVDDLDWSPIGTAELATPGTWATWAGPVASRGARSRAAPKSAGV